MAGTNRKVVVIGGGPGGYTAAFRAADLGMEVTLIDENPNPGGVCLYRGCIPSKAFLHAARVVTESAEASDIGIQFSKPEIDIEKLRSWKNSVVEKLTGGIGMLARQRKVTFIRGRAVFQNASSVRVSGMDGKTESIPFDRAVLATGSRNLGLSGAPDELWDSTAALDLPEIPETLLVVGGGYIGLELGSVYAALGSRVTVAEMLPQIMTGADRDLVSVFMRRAGSRFDAIHTQTRVNRIESAGTAFQVRFSSPEAGPGDMTFERILVSIGRKPNTENLGLENTKVRLDDQGFVQVNPDRSTGDPMIYAIGDITGGPLLAHKASHEGRVAAEAIAGEKSVFDPAVIPGVVYTHPEIAFCGLTETEARETGRNVKVAKFPWAASGRALTMGWPEGLTKLVIDPDTERVLGMGMAGPGAGDMISEGALAVGMGARASDVGIIIHPHPTLSETIMEAADVFYGTSTHVYRPRKD
ncbi:dihydrolipoyl dehydrogenase [bacterium]|nr:dihydrolipoyl dehydrogenase [bacterium]